jgi:(R,R)-butanediol dehydrogenase/meso-butanediol dehydrogenase/diacetyl reductase
MAVRQQITPQPSERTGWSMQAGIIVGQHRLEFLAFPEPGAGPGLAVVEIERCGICGTDVQVFRDGNPSYPPFLCGHEWCGTVSAVGPGVSDLTPDDRVVAGSPPACGLCAECRAGLGHRCARILDLNPSGVPPWPPHGGYAPRIAFDATRLVPIPADLPAEEAAQIEPATVALHAVRRSGLRLGATVLIQGTGPIGLAALQLARAAGAGRVIAVEPNPKRRALASVLGADLVVEPGDGALAMVHEQTHGLGADVVFECAGFGKALDAAVLLTRPGGTVMVVGVAPAPVTIDPELWLIREVTVRISLAHNYEEFAITIGLIRDGRLRLAPLHSKTVKLNDLAATMSALATAGADLCKVLVDPSAGP